MSGASIVMLISFHWSSSCGIWYLSGGFFVGLLARLRATIEASDSHEVSNDWTPTASLKNSEFPK